LKINGKNVLKSNTKDLLFSFDQIICSISEYIMIKTGDLIFTGPVQNPNTINIGDQIEAFIEDECLLRTRIN
jgi:2-keto-4-pentenoate hydratase/2-oxohepta-3-ene-1,7-dioic acid hydratase in catechol pathway